MEDREDRVGAVLAGVVPAEGEEAGPRGCEGGEDLRPLEGVAALLVGDRLRDRPEEDEVVARLGDPEAEELAGCGVAEDELALGHSAAEEMAPEADDDLVHVDAEGGARGGLGEARLLLGDLFEAEARAPEFTRDEGGEVAGPGELGEVVVGEGILEVVGGCALVDPREELVGEEGHDGPFVGVGSPDTLAPPGTRRSSREDGAGSRSPGGARVG